MRFFLGLALLVLALAAARADAPAPMLAQNVFAARGTQATILTITTFGRYLISVHSAQGVALQLVDRMAGPGDVEGSPGAADGRIDAFLERGEYKVRLIADSRGTGTATLAVHGFTELQPAPVQLVEDKPVIATLGDDEQRSWWLVVPARGGYNFEAGGRYLRELRLWKDGSWIVDAAPVAGVSAANPEQPLGLEQLSASLEPGLYRLTAYGGPSQAWPSGSKAAPFMLRWGIPQLSDAGRTIHVASMLGSDRFLVPGTATDLRLVLGRAETASIAAQPFSNDASMFDQSQASVAAMDKTSRDPVADLALPGGNPNTPWLVTVSVKPGETYRLEALNESENGGVYTSAATGEPTSSSSTATLQGGGDTLLAVTLPGDPDDEIDPGFILVDNALNPRVVDAAAIDLDHQLPWRRRFNLLGPVQTYVFTSKNVDLKIDGAGVNAQFLVNRFLLYTPPNVVVPLPQASGGVWQLTPGFYLVSAMPLANGQGILTMSMYADGTLAPKADSPRVPAALFTNAALDPMNGDTLYSSLIGGNYGLRQLALPADLDQPLSFELSAGQSARFPITVPEDGQLVVADGDGTMLGFSLDGNPASGPALVHPGQYQFSITGPGPGVSEITVTDTPESLLAATPLPAIPTDQTAPPVLPALLPDVPNYIDLARGQSMTFALPVARDALYQFETTGLLETGGAIRTRTNPSLAAVEGNGIGRNFLLQPYLREGDYQLTVTAQGQTEGHAGVELLSTPLRDEGLLTPGLPARMTLEPGEAALYRFHIPAEGNYHIFTMGLGHQFAMRLEDADGWPLITPGGAADAAMDFMPGDYRMILLPGAVENRAVSELDPILPPVNYSGHGPFQAVFGADLQNRWMEPGPGGKRVPDVWDFSLPAAADVSMNIDHNMAAVITPAGTSTPVAGPAANWAGRLPAGEYVLTAAASVPDNRVDYNLTLSSAQLLAGQNEPVEAPGSVPISLGGGQVEISSFGDYDVRAELYDAGGRLVAANDDRDNDWNFLITGNFPAGFYTLQVVPVGSDNAQTQVYVDAPAVVEGPALPFGASATVADGKVHVMALPTPAAGTLLLAGASAAVPVGLALEARDSGPGWRSIAATSGIDPYLAMPAWVPGETYRLRVWAEDHGFTPVVVTARAISSGAAPGFAVGLDLQEAALGSQEIAFRRIYAAHQEVLRLSGVSAHLQWSSQPGVAAAHDPSGSITVRGSSLWLVDNTNEDFEVGPADMTAGPVRLTLQGGERLALPVPPAPEDALVLWSAQAQGTQPGVTVEGAPVMAPLPDPGLFKTAVTVQPADVAAPVLDVFQAEAPGDALAVTLRRMVLAVEGKFQAQTGGNDGSVAPNQAVEADLGAGWKRLTLNLPAGMGAVLMEGDAPEGIVLGNGAAPDVLETRADRLVLFNESGAEAPYSAAVQPEAGPTLVLAPGGLITPFSATPAVLHIGLQGAEARIRVAGAASAITVLDADGTMTSGDAAQGGAGATALVTVQPGLAVISQDGDGAANQVAQNVTVPGSVRLSGSSAFFYVPAAGARLVHFETDTPIILRNGNAPEVFPAGANLNLFQAKDSPLDLEILPVSGALSGTATFDAQPAIAITDGLGPRFLAGPGQSRLFSFSLDSPRSVGVGVRGSVDDASVRLLASDGDELASGVIDMRSLPAGTYYLAVDVPADAAASVIQPALVGLTPPDDGPPPDVAEGYREMGDQ